MSDNFVRLLLDFGLNTTEADIYLYLLEHQNLTVVNLSRPLRLPRTTIYDHLDKLIEKGLVQRIIKYKSQQFAASPLDSLEITIKKHQEQVKQLESNLLFLKNNLKFSEMGLPYTKVKYYHGPTGFQQIMWNTLSAVKETVGYSEFGRVDVVGRHFYQKWVDEFKARNLQDRVIINPSPSSLSYINKDVKPLTHQLSVKNIRCLDQKKIHISGDIMIYNQTFAICYWKQKEVVGIEIENPELVQIQKDIFNTLWKIAKPLSLKQSP